MSVLEEFLNATYDPGRIEPPWISVWEEWIPKIQGEGEVFAILMPPPNVTGALHMGHALNNTLQDILVRYHRMQGRRVLWQPGTDHAGIATQTVVERDLLARGGDRKALSDEQFLEEIHRWIGKYGTRIIEQLKRLGASCNFERLRFTLDEGFSRAVRRAFVLLYRGNLIYRGEYLVNFCPRCLTALSDLEVSLEEVPGTLYTIFYPFAGEDSGGGIAVSTTRPETMLGDTAVAVHPDDPRYRSAIGKTLLLPYVGREIPVIADPRVDPEFGTGALKITPAHDFRDAEIGRDHHLSAISIFTPEARVVEGYGILSGKTREEARKILIEFLRDNGYLKEVTPIRHAVGHCYRCHTIVEPYLSVQWFVKTKPLAEKVLAMVQEKRFRFFPEGWEKTFVQWLEGIRDWCISRQILWGHPIPVWSCPNCHAEDVYENEPPSACPRCSGEVRLERDVLDTWFSSALWPLGTLGWPEETEDIKTYYPTTTLVTAFDILFFWVARMAMMGIHFRGEIPFRDIVLHALVRDESGAKMSKTKGNVVDPLEIIERHGADALRFTLASLTAIGRDIRLQPRRIEGYRHFANKLWNAGKFIARLGEIPYGSFEIPPSLHPLNSWVVARLEEVKTHFHQHMESYAFHRYCQEIYQFLWDEYCDWYIEGAKHLLKEREYAEETTAVLKLTYREILRILHPVMPFVTEEIHRALIPSAPPLIAQRWESERFVSGVSSHPFQVWQSAVRAVRNIRQEHGLPPGEPLTVYLETTPSSPLHQKAWRDLFQKMARIEEIRSCPPEEPPAFSSSYAGAGFRLWVALTGITSLAEEIERLKRNLDDLERERGELLKRFENPDFLRKAPQELIASEEARLKELNERLNHLSEELQRLRRLV